MSEDSRPISQAKWREIIGKDPDRLIQQSPLHFLLDVETPKGAIRATNDQ
ncbi:hypothetical protein [Nostoc sp. CHAB 5715]|nr:hypothetical protein [Nostoc sp. CHAB 5715]MCC5626371.1 hypothetical protein [Nostoc sp. CHAB 5715]